MYNTIIIKNPFPTPPQLLLQEVLQLLEDILPHLLILNPCT